MWNRSAERFSDELSVQVRLKSFELRLTTFAALCSSVHPFYWGMWFVAAPVLIHLINMLRHQRVEWAAMEFLLVSQKKHRTWVIFKQLLLLLLRMAAIALVVLALAQPLLPDRWGSFLGAQPTHHIVLLDDSYLDVREPGLPDGLRSGQERDPRLGESVARPREPQTFTLLRLSRCGGRYGGTRPDFQKEPVDCRLCPASGHAPWMSIEVSQTAAEPLPAFEAIQQLLGENAGERRIVYLFSDFRTRQWDKPDDLKKRLAQLDENHAEIRLIDCVEEPGRPNLAIASLEPEEDIRAAGVQWRMQVTRAELRPVRGPQRAGLLVGRRQTGRKRRHRRHPAGPCRRKRSSTSISPSPAST